MPEELVWVLGAFGAIYRILKYLAKVVERVVVWLVMELLLKFEMELWSHSYSHPHLHQTWKRYYCSYLKSNGIEVVVVQNHDYWYPWIESEAGDGTVAEVGVVCE